MSSRSRSIIVAFIVAMSPMVAGAQIPPPPGYVATDEVRLRSGGLVRGQVQEIVPGQYVVLIAAHGGATRRFEWSEVESVILASGVVHGEGAQPPEPEPAEPEPSAEPSDPEPEPPPDPRPVEPEAKVEIPSPHISILVDREGPPVSLRRADADEASCDAPCDRQIDSSLGTFLIESEGTRLGRPFEFAGGESAYRLEVARKDPVKRWSGVALIPATILVGVGIALIPVLNNVPQSQVAGYAAGGAVIGAVGIAGGVTLIMFSRSKVRVLPGRAAMASPASDSM